MAVALSFPPPRFEASFPSPHIDVYFISLFFHPRTTFNSSPRLPSRSDSTRRSSFERERRTSFTSASSCSRSRRRVLRLRRLLEVPLRRRAVGRRRGRTSGELELEGVGRRLDRWHRFPSLPQSSVESKSLHIPSQLLRSRSMRKSDSTSGLRREDRAFQTRRDASWLFPPLSLVQRTKYVLARSLTLGYWFAVVAHGGTVTVDSSIERSRRTTDDECWSCRRGAASISFEVLWIQILESEDGDPAIFL